jgi:DNA-binding NtrC family response regulator
VHSPEEAVAGAAEEEVAGVSKAGQTLLVVEDEEQVRRMVDLGLREHGYRVSSAASVAEALRLAGASSRPFDIVLSDVVLPDGDGLELHERLEDKRPGLFIFTSGYLADPARLQRIKDRGLVFLDKPITVGKIVKTINRARGSI